MFNLSYSCISDFQQLCVLKTARHGAKRSEICDSGTLVQLIWGTFVSNQGHFDLQMSTLALGVSEHG